MDASASSKDADINDVYAFFLKVEDTDFPTLQKQKHSVIKFTKLPEFDYEPKVSWPHNSYILQPRLRRLVTLEDSTSNSTRSLKVDPHSQRSAVAANSNRKIVTISEDDEYDLHPRFANDSKKQTTVPSKAIETETKKRRIKQVSQRNTNGLIATSKCPKSAVRESKETPKVNNVCELKEEISQLNTKSKLNRVSINDITKRKTSEKDTRRIKSASLTKTSISKNLIKPNESEHAVPTKAKLYGNFRNKLAKKPENKVRNSNISHNLVKSKAFSSEMQEKRNLTPVIHVPLEEKCDKVITSASSTECPSVIVFTKSNDSIDVKLRDIYTCTEPMPIKIDQVTDMDGYMPQITYKCIDTSDLQAGMFQDTFDKLDIPNVSLKKEKEFKNDLLDLQSKSVPNLQVPQFRIADDRKEKSVLDTHYSKSTSYIISRATLTYKTQQEINFRAVDSENKTYSNQSPSPVTYPMNVVSVFKEEMRSKDLKKGVSIKRTQENKSSKEYKNSVNEFKSLNSSYITRNKKLLKPSDVINAIRVNNGLLQSVLVCEQFQRELNFIDSFFESLQFLESCSLSGKRYKNNKLNELVNTSTLLLSEFDERNSDYNSFLSKLENGANSDDETMASKNIFLLNILIRDEQRRAKNLLCVLKRREDALKDFTKSQILYLENKKRQDNTDISALKKKQRGALLKLQHECGEMQRMRKALLALSEKRKVALMKTKKDLELKLKNNVHVEQILLSKKKLKRNMVVDRASLPLKCFDLSSSGCEDSSTSRYASDGVLSAGESTAPHPHQVACIVTSAEKSIQTTDSSTGLMERSTNALDENFVVVDGGYLNILFQNLCQPQIFSGGKQYEVNRDALKNIVDSTNSRQQSTETWNDVLDKLMNQPNTDEEDKSSTPSTARSLVEELEVQYYKSLEEEVTQEEQEVMAPSRVYEASEASAQTSLCKLRGPDSRRSAETLTEEARPAGPLPVPAGAPHEPDPLCSDGTACPSPKSSFSSTTGSSASSQPPTELPSPSLSLEPSHVEAEELRRQQLAIEREIKELEQQSRLLVVREIPDKPPPPYTPPVDAKPKHPQQFRVEEITREKIRHIITDSTDPLHDPTDAFQVLVQDFCEETIQKQKSVISSKPWEACNILPQKSPIDAEKLIEDTATELSDVLTPATPSMVSGVSSRRTDHIDDILFAEWRRAEPEWTSLHKDEVVVKNQLFETIFQKILTETVDEYKKTVLAPDPPTTDASHSTFNI